MSVPHEPTPSSRSRLLWPSDLPALDSEWVQSHRSMVESLAQDTMVPLQVLRTALIRRLSHVNVRFMLKPMWSLTQQDMESLSQALRSMQQIAPVMSAHVFSLTQEYQPWFSCVGIEMTQDLDSWPT